MTDDYVEFDKETARALVMDLVAQKELTALESRRSIRAEKRLIDYAGKLIQQELLVADFQERMHDSNAKISRLELQLKHSSAAIEQYRSEHDGLHNGMNMAERLMNDAYDKLNECLSMLNTKQKDNYETWLKKRYPKLE